MSRRLTRAIVRAAIACAAAWCVSLTPALAQSTFATLTGTVTDSSGAAGIGRGLDLLVGGWDVTGVTLVQSGPFLTPFFSNGDPSGSGTTVRGFTATQRPDQVGDGNLGNPTVAAYFDPTAFVRPADNIGRYGNAGVGILVGPGTSVFSMTVGKSFALAGQSRLRFEMAFSNL